MIRQDFKGFNINKVSAEAAEWIGCEPEFISSSLGFKLERDTKEVTSTGKLYKRTRYFEHYQHRHATITLERTELPMSEVLNDWIKNVKTYPPSEIFFQKYGKEAKAEQRIQTICEDLYRFCYPEGQTNILAELSAAYREFEVFLILGMDGIKPERVSDVSKKFLKCAQAACTALEAMHKKDQLLNDYYKSWKVKYQDISTEVYNLTKEFI